jgi:hypothetical protein
MRSNHLVISGLIQSDETHLSRGGITNVLNIMSKLHREVLSLAISSQSEKNLNAARRYAISEIAAPSFPAEKAQVGTAMSVDSWNLMCSCVGAMATELRLSRYSLPAPQTV